MAGAPKKAKAETPVAAERWRMTPFTKWNAAHAVIVFIAVLAFYYHTMPRQVTLEDDGLFTMSSWNLGVSHPAGYPIHTLLGHFFVKVFDGHIDSVPMRVHLLSAVMGAGTCAAVWMLVWALGGGVVAAYLAALCFGVSRGLWSQSIIAEVYSLNTFFFFTMLLGAFHLRERVSLPRMFLFSLWVGLSLSNHFPLIILSSPCILLIALDQPWQEEGRARTVLKTLPMIPLGFLLGLLPYVWMVINSRRDPLIAFYGPLTDFKAIKHYIFRQGYSKVEKSPTWQPEDRWHFYGFLWTEILRQFQALGAAVACAGFALQWRRFSKMICAGLTFAFLGSTVILWWLLKFDFEPVWMNVISVYPLIPYGVMAIWIGLAMREFQDFARSSFGTTGALAAGALAIPLVILIGKAHWAVNNRRDYHFAGDYARAMLNNLERDAILFVHADTDSAPVGCLHYVEGVRPDVDVYNTQGLIFNNRLFHPLRPLSEKRARIEDLIQNTDRPVYLAPTYEHRFGQTNYGLFFKVDKTLQKGSFHYAYSPGLLDYFETVLDTPETEDYWTNSLRDQIITGMAPVLQAMKDVGGMTPDQAERVEGMYKRCCGNYQALMELTSTALVRRQYGEALPLIETLEKMTSKRWSKWQRASLKYYRSVLLMQTGREEEALPLLIQAAALYPVPERNGAVLNLLEYFAFKRDERNYKIYRDRYARDNAHLRRRVEELDALVKTAPNER